MKFIMTSLQKDDYIKKTKPLVNVVFELYKLHLPNANYIL